MTALENFPAPFKLPSFENGAKQLHTAVYLEEGFIHEEDLNEEGLYVDKYSPRSEELFVKMGSKQATIRIIHADKKEGGLLSLPTTEHFAVDPDIIREVAGVTRISDIKADEAVELSGLAAIQVSEHTTSAEAFDATRQTYAQSLRLSLDQGHKLWVMNVDRRLTKFLDIRLGKDSYKVLGEQQEYMGPATIPIAMNPAKVVESILTDDSSRFSDENKADIANVMQGVSEKYLTKKMMKLMHEHQIETSPNSIVSKMWNNRKNGFYAGILGYSAFRALPVGAVDEFDGSLPIFFGIDVGTAATQIASMEMIFKGRNRAVRALGILGTGASFATPYAYFYANGNEYPAYVNAVAGGFAVLGVTFEVKKSIQDAKLKAALEYSDLVSVSQKANS